MSVYYGAYSLALYFFHARKEKSHLYVLLELHATEIPTKAKSQSAPIYVHYLILGSCSVHAAN